jgi:hypothetical protein
MSPKIAPAAIVTDAIITRTTSHFLLQVYFQEVLPLVHNGIKHCPYVSGGENRRLDVVTVIGCTDV